MPLATFSRVSNIFDMRQKVALGAVRMSRADLSRENISF